jgi:uncharacterized protein (DUF3084 family)
LKTDLTSVRREHSSAQDELQQLKTDHNKLTSTHEALIAHTKTLEETIITLQSEKSQLQSAQLELESESAKAKQDYEQQLLTTSDKLKESMEACAVLQTDLKEVMHTLLFAVLTCMLPCSKA